MDNQRPKNPALDFFAKFIESELGIVYSPENYFQLERRLTDIGKQLGIDGIQSLWDIAKAGMPTQMKLLILDTATNNETSFFRDPNVFAGIRQVLSSPEFAPKDRPLYIWSAASSTGQETYSIKMVLDELKDKFPERKVHIYATDYSQRVLDRAKKGEYTQLEVQRGVPVTHLVKYFEQSGQNSVEGAPTGWRIKDFLRNDIFFMQQNLLEPFSKIPNMDIILCRNVLLYQPIENKKKIIAALIQKLNPGGYFILGGAESLVGLSNELKHVSFEKAVFYQKPTEAKVNAA